MTGQMQTLHINTSPPGSTCAVYQDGVRVGVIAATPGTIKVKRSDRRIMIGCLKTGADASRYDYSYVQQDSRLNPWVWGNLVAGGPFGLGVDMITGALRQYGTGHVTVQLAGRERGLGQATALPASWPGSPVPRQVTPSPLRANPFPQPVLPTAPLP
ncbi:hypothetical protein E3E12_02230 [Formicincola oecophyllae]|uniref:Uncharacterized protein n=1 Tax=Formicincola oecophyllae TaxID=2558361 RepID=A0A4Y6UA09_9PROT|nr:hypothetical protein [Formicincola oecophyllae]QDH13211.1 hypothetical protein E3E12_02230 [Formicincola oecophyllae]